MNDNSHVNTIVLYTARTRFETKPKGNSQMIIRSRFVRYVIAAMLEDENKRLLISFYC